MTDAGASTTADEPTESEPQDIGTPEATESTEAPSAAQGFDADKAQAAIKRFRAERDAAADRARKAERRAASTEAAATRVVELEAQLVRERVARRLGLPDALVDRLRGATEEEVMADAEALVALVVKPKVTDLKQGQRTPPPAQFDGNAWLRKAAGIR